MGSVGRIIANTDVPIEDRISDALIRRLNDVRILFEADCRAAAQESTAFLLPGTHDSLAPLPSSQRPERRRLAQNVHTARVLDALQHIGAGVSVGDVLDRLTEAVARLDTRAAVFIVKHGHLFGWRVIGFSLRAANARSVSCPVARAGALGAAVESGRTVSRSQRDAVVTNGAASPSSVQPHGVTVEAMAVPIYVDGAVVAALLTDTVRLESPFLAGRWAMTLDVLVRHASRVLEELSAAGLSALEDDVKSSPPNRAISERTDSVLQSVRRSADYSDRERRA